MYKHTKIATKGYCGKPEKFAGPKKQ